jgi:hypothetical protein
MIHLHETVAKVGLGLMFVTGIIALAGALFYSFRPKLPRLLLVLVLFVLLLNSVVFIYVGYLGGQIHHEEIRSSSSPHLSLNAAAGCPCHSWVGGKRASFEADWAAGTPCRCSSRAPF